MYDIHLQFKENRWEYLIHQLRIKLNCSEYRELCMVWNVELFMRHQRVSLVLISQVPKLRGINTKVTLG